MAGSSWGLNCGGTWHTRDGTRTHNLLLRREAPYPLGHTSVTSPTSSARNRRAQMCAPLTAVGFEPTQIALVELESTPLDHSGKLSLAWRALRQRARAFASFHAHNNIAASEDRTHDLRIMRPTRCQLRYRRNRNSDIHRVGLAFLGARGRVQSARGPVA